MFKDGFDASDNRKESLSAEDSVTDLDAGDEQQQDILISDNTVGKNVILDLNHLTNINDSFNFGSQTDFKKITVLQRVSFATILPSLSMFAVDFTLVKPLLLT